MKELVMAVIMGVLLPASVQAQRVPVPDTTDWRDYFPLQIGNTWEYKYGNELFGEYPEGYEQRAIVGDTLIGEMRYFLHRVERYDAGFELTRTSTDYLRYDTSHTAIVALVEEDGVFREQPWPVSTYTCDLSADFFSEFDCYYCPQCGSVSVYGTYNEGGNVFELDELKSSIVKMFTSRGSGYGVGFVHGVGVEVVDADFEWGYRNDVIYVRLDGREYGRSEVATSVQEAESTVPQATVIEEVFPNPFQDQITVMYVLSSPRNVSVELYDVLGRQVLYEEIGWRSAGSHATVLEGSGLAAGVYFVRIASQERGAAMKQVLLLH